MQQVKINKWLLILIFIVGTLLVLLTPLQRYSRGNPLTPGAETYQHLNAISEGNLNFYDLIINGLTKLVPLEILVILVPFILSLISGILFYQILKKIVKTDKELYLSLGIFFLTPAFITMNLGLSVYSLMLTLSLAAILTFMNNSKSYLLLSFLTFLLAPIIGIVLYSVFLIQNINKKRKLETKLILLILVINAIMVIFIPFILRLFANTSFHLLPNELFNFLGSTYGYVLFSFALGLIGFYSTKNTLFKTDQKLYLTLILLISLFYEPLRILLIPFFAFFAARALCDLIKQKWSINYLKDLTTLLFICMILFSAASTISENNNSKPSLDQQNAYLFIQALRDKNPEINNSKVLTDEKYEEQLEYFSKLESYSKNNDEQETSTDLLKSRDYQLIKDVFQKEKVSFVYIDESMLNGNILDRPDQGILFVMENNDNFKLIYQKENTKIYYFTIWDGDN